jgi:hypothetical protein
MEVSRMVVFTTFSQEDPAASRMAPMFFMTCNNINVYTFSLQQEKIAVLIRTACLHFLKTDKHGG